MQSRSWCKHFPEAEHFTAIRPVGDFSFWSLLQFLKRKGNVAFYVEQLDVNKQAGQWARLYKQVRAAEARLRQAEQETPASQTPPPVTAKQQETPTKRGEAAQPTPETAATDERQAQLRAIAGDLLYWKKGLKVLRQAKLPKWRGSFKWQIEAKIEALQAAYARLRAEGTKPDG